MTESLNLGYFKSVEFKGVLFGECYIVLVYVSFWADCTWLILLLLPYDDIFFGQIPNEV